jgi:hypothetical protein
MMRLGAMLAAVVAVLFAAAVARAHPALGTVVSVHVVQTPDGPMVEAVVMHDALAYALNDTSARVSDPQMRGLVEGPREELAAALQDGRERFASGFWIVADGERLAIELVVTPTVEHVDRWRLDSPAMPLPCKGEFVARARLPRDARGIRVRAPVVFDGIILSVSVPGHEVVFLPVAAGEESPTFDVRLAGGADEGAADEAGAEAEEVDGAGEEDAGDGASRDEEARGPSAVASTPPLLADEIGPSWLEVAWRYAVLGFRHIVPKGHDHALFILGLFLLNKRVRDVLWQTTAFTIAHTCTLSLATLGLVAAPEWIVEPIIAASIAFIAIENIVTTRVSPWRPAIAFLFGLVHGMGFAAGLVEIGLPTDQLATAIVGFGVGVEAGHLAILAAAYVTLGWWRERTWYRGYVAIPLSAIIAAIAVFWFVERVI